MRSLKSEIFDSKCNVISWLGYTLRSERLALWVILLLALGRCCDAPSRANVGGEPQRSHVLVRIAVSSL